MSGADGARFVGSPYGWRGRVGLLVPSVNTVVEPEFARLMPPGISVHAARLRNQRNDLRDGLGMLDHLERAADELGSARVDVLVLACTTASFIRGRAGEQELCARILRAAAAALGRQGTAGGVPWPAAVTTSGAVVGALQKLGLGRVVLVTPYLAEVNTLEEAFLRQHGVEVVAADGQPVEEACDIAGLRPETVYRIARAAAGRAGASVDGLFISGTNLPTLPIIGTLEEDTGKPVVTSNQATAWAALRALGCPAAVSGYGRLLTEGA